MPYFIKLAIHHSMSPVYRPVVEKFGDKWTQPENFVGNGAFKVKEWVINERLVLERNPKYWDNAHTVLNKVTFLPISSEVTDTNRYRSGGSDMTYNYLPIELYQKLKKRSRRRSTPTRISAPTITKSITRSRRLTMYACAPR